MNTADLIEQYRSSVVLIECRDTGSKGSGFLISDSGHIVTNNHVLGDVGLANGGLQVTYSAQIVVHHGGNEYPAFIGHDSSDPAPVVFDYAILSAAIPTLSPFLTCGSLASVRQGDPVVCLGYPLDFDDLVATSGIASALIARPSHINSLHAMNTVLTDALINRGNSGGPMLHMPSQSVIGINTRKHTVEDLLNIRLMQLGSDPAVQAIPGLVDLIKHSLWNIHYGLYHAVSLEYASSDSAWPT